MCGVCHSDIWKACSFIKHAPSSQFPVSVRRYGKDRVPRLQRTTRAAGPAGTLCATAYMTLGRTMRRRVSRANFIRTPRCVDANSDCGENEIDGEEPTAPITIENADAQHDPRRGQTLTFTAVVRNVGRQPARGRRRASASSILSRRCYGNKHCKNASISAASTLPSPFVSPVQELHGSS